MSDMGNADPAEVHKFSELAHRWWDPDSEFWPLHQINPLRMGWIEARVMLKGAKVVDVGCGGGLLSEAMAVQGAEVTAIDLSDRALAVARLHLHESGVEVDYRHESAEALARSLPGEFDVVTCMEMLEHVPDPESVVRACATLLKPGGCAFFSTINRNPKSYLLAIVAAEYMLGMLPRGTHDFAKFIRPSELARWVGSAGLDIDALIGLHYDPLGKRFGLGSDVGVNFMLCAHKPMA